MRCEKCNNEMTLGLVSCPKCGAQMSFWQDDESMGRGSSGPVEDGETGSMGRGSSGPVEDGEKGRIGSGPQTADRPEKAGGAASAAELAKGELLSNRYRIVRRIDRGGMGLVYMVLDTRMDDAVHALKVFDPRGRGIGDIKSLNESLMKEAFTGQTLSHENIVAIRHFQPFEEKLGFAYFVMEYVDGRSMRDRLGDGRLEAKEAVSLLRQVCAGLAYAHGKNIVHGDLKPENLLIRRRDQTVKIADFGLAQRMSALTGAARPRKCAGTRDYMAPEQFRSLEALDGRADIFALGMIAHELAAGHLPERDKEHHVLADPISRRIPAPLRGIVVRATKTNPEDRFQKIEEIQALLRDASPEGDLRRVSTQVPVVDILDFDKLLDEPEKFPEEED